MFSKINAELLNNPEHEISIDNSTVLNLLKIQSATKELLKIYESNFLSYEEDYTLEDRINIRILKLHEITEFFKKNNMDELN